MNDKLQQELAPQTAPFSRVEPALAKTLGYSPNRIKALRARLRYLQRFLGPAAGKGSRISYAEEDILRLLIALRVQEHGVDPHVAAVLVRDHWKTIAHYVRQATDERSEGNPVFLTLRLRAASEADDADKISWVGGFRRYDYRLTNAQGAPAQRENIGVFLDRMGMGQEHELGGLILHNLTAIIRRLRSHLADGAPTAIDADREAGQ